MLRDIPVAGRQTVRRLSRSWYLVCKYLRVVVLRWGVDTQRNLEKKFKMLINLGIGKVEMVMNPS